MPLNPQVEAMLAMFAAAPTVDYAAASPQDVRALFDVPVEGKAPTNLRCYLKLGDKTLSETWIYQYFPPS